MRDRVRLRTRVAGLAEPVVLPDDDGDVLVYGIPYLDPDFARVELADGPEPLARSHEAVTSAAMRRIRADLAARAGSARPRSVGGRARVRHRRARRRSPSGTSGSAAWTRCRPGCSRVSDYVALGHLHGPQRRRRVGRDGPAVQRLAARVLVLRAAPRQVVRAGGPVAAARSAPSLVAAPVPRRLADVTGTLEDLLGAAGEPHADAWARVTVTDAHRPRRPLPPRQAAVPARARRPAPRRGGRRRRAARPSSPRRTTRSTWPPTSSRTSPAAARRRPRPRCCAARTRTSPRMERSA